MVQKDDPQVSRYHYHHSARDSSLLCSSLQNPTTYPHLRIKNRNPSPITPALCPVYVAFVWCSSVVGMLRSLWTVYIPCNTERTFCDIACYRFLPWRGAMRTRNAIWPRGSRVEQENHGRGWIVYVFDGSSLSRYDEDDPSDGIDESYWYWRTDSFFRPDNVRFPFSFLFFFLEGNNVKLLLKEIEILVIISGEQWDWSDRSNHWWTISVSLTCVVDFYRSYYSDSCFILWQNYVYV